MSVGIILALSLFGLGVAFYYSSSVKKVAVDMGVEDAEIAARLKKIHLAIANGAMAFLKQEYKFMAIFMVVFAAIIAVLIDDHHTDYVNEGIYTAVAFI
ncbi:MAG: sodium/proton-translocating pyrophosphatase, partial [Xanthomonadales bacterium]|nr:sodium/proton-translocating pyrophosphatase [Xanthomonadales bacterium]